MLSPEIVKRIRSIELHTKKILSGSFVGQTRTKNKGSGFEFDCIREYQQGDDIRFIDWKSSARSNKLLVRQYNQECSRTIMLMVDGSASGLFTSDKMRKYDAFVQVASVLALVAQYSNDAVGLVIFSDTLQKIVPPVRGRMQAMKIMDLLFNFKPEGLTDLSVPFDYLARIKRRDVMAFVLSDFIDSGVMDRYKTNVWQAARCADIIAIRFLDRHERKFAFKGFMYMQDIETGQVVPVDMRLVDQLRVNGFLQQRISDQDSLLRAWRVDKLDISVADYHDHAFISPLIQFFTRRMLR